MVVATALRVLLMGDSQAYLLSYELPELAKRDGVVFTSVVVAGSSLISWSSGLDIQWAQIRRFEPDTILVALGSNDVCMGSRVVKNERPFLQRMLKRFPTAEIIWVGPPRIKRRWTESATDLFKQMIESAGIRYLDSREVDMKMWPDQLHCARPQFYGDENGCKTWAEWIWKTIR